MSDETGIRDMTGSIIPQFAQTQLTDAWMKNDNQPINSNSQSSTITNVETGISDSGVYNPIISISIYIGQISISLK